MLSALCPSRSVDANGQAVVRPDTRRSRNESLSIASPEMFPEAEMLSHLICSRPVFIDEADDGADQQSSASAARFSRRDQLAVHPIHRCLRRPNGRSYPQQLGFWGTPVGSPVVRVGRMARPQIVAVTSESRSSWWDRPRPNARQTNQLPHQGLARSRRRAWRYFCSYCCTCVRACSMEMSCARATA
jgi:hypothetical protein